MDSITGLRGPSPSLSWRDPGDPSGESTPARREPPRPSTPARGEGTGGDALLLSRLRGRAAALRNGSAWRKWRVTATPGVSGRALLSAVAGPGCVPGVHRVEVIELARTERVHGSPEPEAATPLGLAGEFHLNGRPIAVGRDQSLMEIRDRINEANCAPRPSGVTATVLTTALGSHRLVLTADHPGSRGIELVDGPGARGALRWLGIADGTTTPNRSPADAARTETHRFPDPAAPLGAQLELSGLPPAAISIGGRRVRVELSTDSLLDLLERVGADSGAVVEERVGGADQYRLSVAGEVRPDPGGAPEEVAASARVLELLGLVRPVPLDALEGADALLRLDGALVRHRGNLVPELLPGVTLSLLATDAAMRVASVTGAGLSLGRDPRTVPPGRYPIRAESPPEAGRTTVTIGGEAAEWDAAAGRVRGGAGSSFEGLELVLSPAPVAGELGELVVTGDIAVSLTVERDWDAAVAAVAGFATAYNEVVTLARRREGARAGEARPASRRLARAVAHLLTAPLPEEEGMGIHRSRAGVVEVDDGRLRDALRLEERAAQEFFAAVGNSVLDALDRAAAELAREMRTEAEAEPTSATASPTGEDEAPQPSAGEDERRTAYTARGARGRGHLNVVR